LSDISEILHHEAERHADNGHMTTRSSAIADKPALTNRAMLVCKVVEVWQDFLSEYLDKKFTYICYRRLIDMNESIMAAKIV